MKRLTASLVVYRNYTCNCSKTTFSITALPDPCRYYSGLYGTLEQDHAALRSRIPTPRPTIKVMDTIAELKSREIEADIVSASIGAFLPLLEEKRTAIQEIPRKTFRYGSTDRHQLDVYYPVAPSASEKTQVLVWIYGGGFTTGERQFPPPADLLYACVGAYFARRGFVVVIPDYRLLHDAIFPGGAEDVRDAILWTINNPAHLTTPTTPNPDTKGIFLMGHSAGAVYAFSAFVIPETAGSAILRPSIAGLILCAGPYHLDALDPADPLHDVAKQLCGGEQGVQEKSPMGLLRDASDAVVAQFPRTVLVIAEREPDWLLAADDAFAKALEARTGKKPARIVAQGHNHISPNVALGTGQGEAWAEEVVTWIRS
ncbi:putative carboxylesterase family protein [Lyophyllum shimeji]|uniref:Carboxylesterase family protein n=1 Tax=Lyophyllum shimeji TaxID=47721 RepID=A0A9P3PW60_LYOSH|nr:putative carboxylesterase family protein [Lyophyllum shimeji]